MDGTYSYYSCDLAVKLMRASTERGPWSDLLRKAYYNIHKTPLRSIIYYLESAYLGSDIGLLNGAILIDKLNVLKDKVLDISQIQKDIENDPVYLKMLKNSKNIMEKYDNILYLIYSDLKDLIPSDYQSQSKFLELFEPKAQTAKEFRNYLSYTLYDLSALEGENLAYLKLGDYNYYGIYTDIDYKQALSFYKSAVAGDNADYKGQAFFNLGFMYQQGIGCEKNLTKAALLYNKSLHSQDAKNPFYNLALKTFIDYADQGNTFNMESIIESVENFVLQRIQSPAFKTLLFALTLFGLLIYKKRVENLSENQIETNN